MPLRPSLLAAVALALAFLPSVQAQGPLDPVLDPSAHDCQGPVDDECQYWACHNTFEGCGGPHDGWECTPGYPDCVQVTCGLYLETPVLLFCAHNGFVPFVRCMAADPHATCTDELLRE